MREKRYTALQLLLAALGGALILALALVFTIWLLLGRQVLDFTEAWAIIETRFVGDYDPEVALDRALDGLVAGLGDRWSYAMSKEDYQAQKTRRANAYIGIGVTVSFADERGLLVEEVKENSPAQTGGILPGDIIIAVDGTPVAGDDRWAGSDLIKGEAGTSLTLTLLSETGEEREVTVKRVAVDVEPVTSRVLEGNVGYVKLSNFYNHSGEKLNAAVDDLVEQGVTALIFDMRSNGGGYVSELTTMLKHILPAGPVFRSVSPGGRVEVEKAAGEGVDLPMAVLVNADSYSAAELFAAQCKESVGALVVGEPTCGKGYSQQTVPLVGGGAINVSTGKYTTGGGVSLVGTGVELDAEVYPEEGSQVDAQLQKALELLKK